MYVQTSFYPSCLALCRVSTSFRITSKDDVDGWDKPAMTKTAPAARHVPRGRFLLRFPSWTRVHRIGTLARCLCR